MICWLGTKKNKILCCVLILKHAKTPLDSADFLKGIYRLLTCSHISYCALVPEETDNLKRIEWKEIVHDHVYQCVRHCSLWKDKDADKSVAAYMLSQISDDH